MADTFGWRVTFALVSVLTAVLMASMAVSLPRNSHPAKIGFLRQFRLFFDRRIQLGVADVVFGAAASYVFYTYLSPIMRDEIGVPERYISIGLVIYGCLPVEQPVRRQAGRQRSWRGTIDPHSTDLLRAGRLPVSAGFRLAAGGWRHDPAASIRRTLTVLAESNRTRPVSCRYQLRGEPNQLV